MPPGGALGRRTATVTAHPNVRVGAGWIGTKASIGGFAPNATRRFRRRRRRRSGERTRATARVTPFPSYVTVSPVAAMGDHIIIGGLRGGGRVHVFGQGARPFSAVVPRGVDAARIATPRLAVGAAGAPGIVPGFVYVQVLARPGQPATGSTFVKVLLVDGPGGLLAELDALGRGAGALRASLDAGGRPASPRRAGSSAPPRLSASCTTWARFSRLYWRSLLYTPAGRAATRVITEEIYGVVAGAAFPALRAAAPGRASVDLEQRRETLREGRVFCRRRRFRKRRFFQRRKRFFRDADAFFAPRGTRGTTAETKRGESNFNKFEREKTGEERRSGNRRSIVGFVEGAFASANIALW